jgi:hypothetical protein
VADRISVYEAALSAPERPTCPCCRRLLPLQQWHDRRWVCVLCEQAIAAGLREIGALWPQLADRLEKGKPGGRQAPRAAAGAGSKAPLNLGALSLLAGEVTRELRAFEDDWRRVLGWPVATFAGNQDQTLKTVVAFLLGNLYWACHDDGRADVHGLHQVVERLVWQMTSAVTGESDPRVPVNQTCPLPAAGFDPDDPQAPECGGPLLMDPRVPEIRCAQCRTATPRHRWLELGVTVGTIDLTHLTYNDNDQGAAA